MRFRRGVAQLVARSVRDAEVVGSNPVASTKNTAHPCGCAVFFVNADCDGVRGSEPFCESNPLCLMKLGIQET